MRHFHAKHTLYNDRAVGTDWRHSELHITLHKLVVSTNNKCFAGLCWLPKLQVSRRHHILAHS